MNTAPAARRTHLLFLAVDADTRREMRFADHAEGVEVYSFDGLDAGVESTRIVSREEGRARWTAALAEGYVWTRSMVALPPAPPAPVAVAVAVEPAPVAVAKPSFESDVCSRCWGSGHFSRCQSYGTTCFKCAGSGRTLTLRGKAASAYLTLLRSKRTDAIVVGDVVYHRGGGPFPASWETVTDADWSAKRIACGWAPESMVRVRQTREQSAATWDAALAYQATLTKAGTPRKVAKRAEAVATA